MWAARVSSRHSSEIIATCVCAASALTLQGERGGVVCVVFGGNFKLGLPVACISCSSDDLSLRALT